MTKTTLSFISFMCLGTIAFAQKENGIYIVPNMEIGISGNHAAKMANYKFDNSQKQNIGVDAGYMLNGHFGIFTGLGLGLYNANYRDLDNNLFMDQHQVSIENPFYLRYKTNKAQRVNFFGNAGIRMSYNMGGSYTSITQDGTIGIKGENEIFNKVAASPFINAGITFKFRNSNWIDLGAFYSYSVSDTYNSDLFSSKKWVAGIKFAFGFGILK